jgi:DNA-directed RNA polymerase beta subunit
VPKKYHALEIDGLARVGSKLNNGDVYVNKITPKVPSNAFKSMKQ